MRSASRPSSRPAATTLTKVVVGLVSLLAVIMGLLSMHALDTAVSQSVQPAVFIADVIVDSTDHIDSIATVTSSDGTITVAGLIGCAAAGVLCALGALALVKRALRAREPAPAEPATTSSPRPRLAIARTIPRTAPSLFALTVIRT